MTKLIFSTSFQLLNISLCYHPSRGSAGLGGVRALAQAPLVIRKGESRADQTLCVLQAESTRDED